MPLPCPLTPGHRGAQNARRAAEGPRCRCRAGEGQWQRPAPTSSAEKKARAEVMKPRAGMGQGQGGPGWGQRWATSPTMKYREREGGGAF